MELIAKEVVGKGLMAGQKEPTDAVTTEAAGTMVEGEMRGALLVSLVEATGIDSVAIMLAEIAVEDALEAMAT